jgi:hypothetical protein
MLRTDEAMIKTLHAYSFHWADRSRWEALDARGNRNEYQITDGREK